MEILEPVLVVLLIVSVIISVFIGLPMRKHLLAETEIRKIGLFQMPFYLKDYHRMIYETENVSNRNKYRKYFTIFLISNTAFIIAGIILILMPGSL